jgi:MoxR-like ATPase
MVLTFGNLSIWFLKANRVFMSNLSPGDNSTLVGDAVQVLSGLPGVRKRLMDEVGKVLIGQREILDQMLFAMLARGHCLLVGMPGVAKTLMVNAVSRAVQMSFARVQFTPDLMPGDITGSEIIQEEADSGRRSFVFKQGPVFTEVLLADEINRTPPKTQAALLEAMQEKTVTVAGKIHRLPSAFTVFATQNPLEQEGTYPLPEAQLDRFLFELRVGYPTLEEESQIVSQHSFTPLDRINPVVTCQEIVQMRDAVAKIPAAPNVVSYAVRLVRATRPDAPDTPDYIKRWIRWGASPRASLNLILAGRARAACEGRFNVSCEDVAALAVPILRHRLVRSFQADAEGISTEAIVQKLIEEISR